MADFLGFVAIVVVCLVCLFFAAESIIKQSEKDAKWEGRCEALHAKVYQMDGDHRVCLRNGKVVTP